MSQYRVLSVPSFPCPKGKREGGIPNDRIRRGKSLSFFVGFELIMAWDESNMPAAVCEG